MPPFDELLTRLGVHSPIGATDARIDAFEAATGCRLPSDVRALFCTCDGVRFGDAALRLFSLDQARERYDLLRSVGYPSYWGCVPVADGFDSDPLCVCTEPPLTGYLVHLRHDASSGPAFRSVGSFLAALAPALDAGPPEDGIEWFPLDRVPYDFAAPERTMEDVAIGRRLLALAAGMGVPARQTPDHDERAAAFPFGLTLLSDTQVGEVAAFLTDARDPFILVCVEARLREMAPRIPAAAEALRRHGEAQAAFLERCRAVLESVGIGSKPERREFPLTGEVSYLLTVREGYVSASYDGRALYVRRDEPGFHDWFTGWARKQLSQKH